MANKQNCLDLGLKQIGSKSSDMGSDVFDNMTLNLKNTPVAANFLLETETHLTKQYKEIYDDTMQELLTFPPHYEFGTETKKGEWARQRRRIMQYEDESLVNQRIQQLNQKSNPSSEDVREKTHLELILTEKIPLSTEAKVIMRFQTFFTKYRGLLLHSYKPETYLQRYVELAKDLRQAKNSPQLTTLEKDILKLLNISSGDVDTWVATCMKNIEIEQSKTQGASTHSFAGAIIQNALALEKTPKKERKNQWNELKRTFSQYEFQWDSQRKKMVQSNDEHGNPMVRFYEKSDIQSKLYQSEFQRLTTRFNDEFDCLVFLPDQQLILGVEIKQAMKTNTKANDKQTKEAAQQTEKRKEYISKTFGDLLNNGWRYVKIIAVYDNLSTIVINKCSDCSEYILTNGTSFEEEQQMNSLMNSLTTNSAIECNFTHRNPTAFDEFKHLLSRLIGLSGSLMAVQKLGPYHEIMGTDSNDLNAGWTRASALKFGLEDNLPREGDIFGRSNDIYKLIFYSPDQIGLLSMSKRFVVFLNDYGSGNIDNPQNTYSLILVIKKRIEFFFNSKFI